MMIEVFEDIRKVKEYYDSLTRYQRLFIHYAVSPHVDSALNDTPIDPLKLCLALRESNSYFSRFFIGLIAFIKSKTFEFYTNAFDTLVSFNLPITSENFEIVLANQSPSSDLLKKMKQVDNQLERLEQADQLAEDEMQQIYTMLATHIEKDPAKTDCYVYLQKAKIMNPRTCQDVDHDESHHLLKESLEIMFGDGQLTGSDAQTAFDILMGSYRALDRIEGASIIKELHAAGLLGEEEGANNHSRLQSSDRKSNYLILKRLNDNKCPISQERFDKILALSSNVRAVLVEEIEKWSFDENALLMWTHQYFDEAIALLSQVDIDPYWQGKENLVTALHSHKAEISQTEKKLHSSARQQNGLFIAGEGAAGKTQESTIQQNDTDPPSTTNS